jgi:predicted metal-dependent hydrolase
MTRSGVSQKSWLTNGVFRRVAVLPLLAALLAAGCGDGGGRREDVASYIERVNSIQLSMRQPLVALAQATREFSLNNAALRRARPRLAKSERAIHTLDRRLRELDPPPEAQRLHKRLLQLVTAEAALTRELRQTTVYLPQLQTAVKPLTPAGRNLRRALASAKNGQQQAKALDEYQTVLELTMGRLRALDPPALLAGVHRAQYQTLQRVDTAAAALAAALRRKDAAALPKRIHNFQQASLSGDSVSAQRARIAGIQGYNARVKELRKIARDVQRERDRLQKTLK